MNFKYITTTTPLGGRIKQIPQDFRVSEIGVDYITSIKYLPDKKVEGIDWDTIFNNKQENKDYLIVDMEKINTTTTSAINQLSRFIHVSRKKINYAGLKDKRSISSQRLSIYNPSKGRISKFLYKNIKIYNPFWSSEDISIGKLKSNRFEITIRQIENKSKEDVKKIILEAFKEIKEKSLINYFGEQRFGGIREITHKVGKLILMKRYKEAVILYLTSTSSYENQEIQDARNSLKETLDFRKHAAHFPSRTGYEIAMLNYLSNNPNDFLGALKVLPKAMQYLFTHAYQSYLFNELINLRFERGYGLDKIPGDKIIDGEIYLPLFGFESKFSESTAGELERELLKKENISFNHFRNSEYSVVSSKGEFRRLTTTVDNLELIDISEDELNEGMLKATVSFVLNKGQYATVLMRELIKKEIIG